ICSWNLRHFKEAVTTVSYVYSVWVVCVGVPLMGWLSLMMRARFTMLVLPSHVWPQLMHVARCWLYVSVRFLTFSTPSYRQMNDSPHSGQGAARSMLGSNSVCIWVIQRLRYLLSSRSSSG